MNIMLKGKKFKDDLKTAGKDTVWLKDLSTCFGTSTHHLA